MRIIESKTEDLQQILSIISDAQRYLASQNIDQWQDGYPNKERILLDIENQESFVLIDEINQISATAMFTSKPEPTYKNIDGNWLTSTESVYGVVHRIAIRNENRGKGYAKYIITYFEHKLKEKTIDSMRIDTHEDNLGMQNLLKKLNYTYCGVIYLENGDKRLAFEKLLK